MLVPQVSDLKDIATDPHSPLGTRFAKERSSESSSRRIFHGIPTQPNTTRTPRRTLGFRAGVGFRALPRPGHVSLYVSLDRKASEAVNLKNLYIYFRDFPHDSQRPRSFPSRRRTRRMNLRGATDGELLKKILPFTFHRCVRRALRNSVNGSE